MAKYKHPKNEKHKARKDLKDYTVDKDVEGMVPNASGEIMPEVPRKDDKELIDDAENMVPKVKDADRVYVTKEMEDGDPKMPANALKTFTKNQKEDAEELIDTLAKKDGSYMSQIKKLTKEQKEELVRRIVKNQIESFLNEAALAEQDDESEETSDDQKALADTPETPAVPEAPAIPADSPGSEEATADPEGTTSGEEEEPEVKPIPPADDADDASLQGAGADRVEKFIQAVEEKPGAFQQMKLVLQVIKRLTKKEDTKQSIARLGLLKRAIDSLLAKQGADPKQ